MTYEKLFKNIELLSAKSGVSKTTALIQSGVGKNFFYNINKGSAPSAEKIQLLANYFNVSTDYLLGNSDNPHNNIQEFDPLTTEAIKLFASLSAEKRKLAIKVIKSFLDEDE